MSGGGGAAQFDGRLTGLDQFGLLDHHHGIGATRDDAAGGNGRGRAGRHFDFRRVAAGDHFGVEHQPLGRAVAGAEGVGRTQREAVDIGAIEWRRVDRGDHIMREHTRERSRKRHRLGRKRLEIEMPLEARARFLGGNDFEELFLLRRRAHARDEIGLRARLHLALLAHGQALTATLVPAG